MLNDNVFPDILPHTTLELDMREDRLSPAVSDERFSIRFFIMLFLMIHPACH